jgi:cation/acetate symporter
MFDRTEDAPLFDRASLDGRIAFVSAAFLLAFGFAALLDRVGAPERFVGAAAPWFTIIALGALGFLLHSTRVATYYFADRLAPGVYAGFANATLLAAMLLPFAARLAGHSWSIGVFCGAWLGLAGGALVVGPLLRKSGACSINDLLAARFADPVARFGLIIAVALAAGLLAVAGDLIAVEALVDITGAQRRVAAFAIVAVSLLIAGPGGVGGALWTTVAAGGVAILGLGWPVAALWLDGALPVRLSGDGGGWADATQRLAEWGVMPPSMNTAVETALTVSIALGVVALAPMLVTAVTTPDPATARRSGISAMLWGFVFALVIAAVTASAAIAFANSARGVTAERLPDAIFAGSTRGLVSVCGDFPDTPAAAQRACAARAKAPGQPLAPADVRPADTFYLLGALPAFSGLGAAVAGLIASALIALGLGLAAMGLQACGTALGHDALYRLRGESDLSSRRLAITRLVLVGVSAFGYLVSMLNFIAPGELVAVAIAISTACVAPALLLAFVPQISPRSGQAAVIGGVTGLILALALAETRRRVEIYGLAGLSGAMLAIVAACGYSIFDRVARRDDDPAGAMGFVARLLRGDGRVLTPDRDA